MESKYDIDTQAILHGHHEKFSVTGIASSVSPWWNRTLTSVNDTWLRLGVLDGDFHWHKHDETDEFFMVLEGRLDIELEDKTIELGPGDAVTIGKGVMHFPHAHGRVVVLMAEAAGVNPTGD